ncbi:cilia- and flagella-associated protein 276 isoform X1 [Phacochoerus africanus]|uniref:cilia- and flagella-associated protein 276 isoform X1 n=1 Tax=Phacochoerus africanus TaxID=41426 RepID=UPI001FD8C083|nr:cilia- and flagella-associated protein 276 isoform X1 [Phacochoerus africanus]
MPLTRDPFQHSTLDNDDSYLGKIRASKKLPYKNPTHLAQQQEPWCRLSSTATITSMRRDACFFDPEDSSPLLGPNQDSSERLRITESPALYNHHSETFKNKSEILIHQETIQDTHGIKIQFPGESLPPPQPPPITSQANIRHWINPKKESIHSIQGSIVSPHTAATNRGYSRKNDGGFFST